ncbi:ATP-dependent serine protease [Burkholderia ambifaria]|uniref:ATP-dependent serine protease n=1 Tax=Burkholderia ambifaria TaxID=152480 RepID=UPI001588B127|nr:ATP-dependent serine protease [Burkholderia ambifaria]
MQVLPNRKVRTLDTLRGALNLRAEPHGAVSQRCRECGFLAFRASEQCPVCGVGDWPFTPLRDRRGDAQAGQATPPQDTPPPVPAWSSRVAAAVRSAAIRRPRASSAPLMSILTVVLMVGGYVTFDRTCRADPACRGPATPGATTIYAGARGADAPTLPVVPVPVYAFHRADDKPAAAHETPVATDDTQIAAEQPRVADTSRRATSRSTARATTTLARHAPPVREPQHARNGVHVADWKGSPARRTHALHRVSAHTRHGHRAAATDIQLAGVYRGH